MAVIRDEDECVHHLDGSIPALLLRNAGELVVLDCSPIFRVPYHSKNVEVVSRRQLDQF